MLHRTSQWVSERFGIGSRAIRRPRQAVEDEYDLQAFARRYSIRPEGQLHLGLPEGSVVPNDLLGVPLGRPRLTRAERLQAIQIGDVQEVKSLFLDKCMSMHITIS